MNIEILISLDGEQLPLNVELNNTITSIVNSYVKQKLTGFKATEKKVKSTVNYKGSIYKGFWTLEKKEDVFFKMNSLMALGKTQAEAYKELAPQFGVSEGAIYQAYLKIKRTRNLVSENK